MLKIVVTYDFFLVFGYFCYVLLYENNDTYNLNINISIYWYNYKSNENINIPTVIL